MTGPHRLAARPVMVDAFGGPTRDRTGSGAGGQRTYKQAPENEQERRPGDDSYEIHEQHSPGLFTEGGLDQTLL